MWWIRIFVILLTYLTGNLDISDIKIWKFSTSTRHGGHNTGPRPRHSHLGLNNKLGITYDPDVLRRLEANVNHDDRLKILSFGAIRTIRSLGLNIKPRSCRHKRRIGFSQHGVNRTNLVKAKKTSYHDPNIILATLNIHSFRNKE